PIARRSGIAGQSGGSTAARASAIYGCVILASRCSRSIALKAGAGPSLTPSRATRRSARSPSTRSSWISRVSGAGKGRGELAVMRALLEGLLILLAAGCGVASGKAWVAQLPEDRPPSKPFVDEGWKEGDALSPKPGEIIVEFSIEA